MEGNEKKTIHFKNGLTKEVSQKIATVIRDRIIDGAKTFQLFSDEKNDFFLAINVQEIVYID